MESCGVIVLCRPVSRRLFDQAVYLLAAMRSRWCELEEENRRLREMLKAVLDELLKHGADIHDFRRDSGSRGLPAASIILRNAEEGRELLDGLHGLDPDSSAFKPYTMKYRGKERLVTPSRTVEDYRQEYEIQWRELEPILRAYYA